MNTKQKIAVMQAFIDGKSIEFLNKNRAAGAWERCPTPAWDWLHFGYRVKIEPRTLYLVNVPTSGAVNTYRTFYKAIALEWQNKFGGDPAKNSIDEFVEVLK